MDRRNAIHKLTEWGRVMREQGWTNEDNIPFEDAAYWVAYVFGKDSRTIKTHMVDLVKYGYLVPVGRQLTATPKTVTKMYPSGKVVPITYRGDTKGLYRAYRFGPKLRVMEYQETLNPKYVPPPPPFDNVVKESISNSRKNMCDLRKAEKPVMDNESEKLLAYLEGRIDNKNNNNVSRSHILLDTKSAKEEKNSSFLEIGEKRGENLVSNTVVSDKSVLDTKNVESQKMGIQGKEAEDKPNLLDTELKSLVSNTSEKLDTEIRNCPKCGKKGCLTSRWVLNAKKKRYSPYYYFKHYEKGRIKWCYIGRYPH